MAFRTSHGAAAISTAVARVRVYLEMIRFSHTLFALPFAAIALMLAVKRLGELRPWDVVGVLACMVFARSAAMSFNRWADRDVDARNPRTAGRHIPAGVLSANQVGFFTLLCSLLFIASTGFFRLSSGNWLPLAFSIPMLLFLFGYSYAKRFTSLSHLWLGVALAASPVAVWVATLPPGSWTPYFLLAGVVALWVAGFDVIYACQDFAVDRSLGLFSIPAKLGIDGSLWVARFLHFLMLVALALFGLATPELGRWFWVGFGVVAVLLVVEHRLARTQDLAKINLAFFQMNAAIGLALLAVVGLDLAASAR
jgi:4-hydroxybenzoate polyprenyltransferase